MSANALPSESNESELRPLRHSHTDRPMCLYAKLTGCARRWTGGAAVPDSHTGFQDLGFRSCLCATPSADPQNPSNRRLIYFSSSEELSSAYEGAHDFLSKCSRNGANASVPLAHFCASVAEGRLTQFPRRQVGAPRLVGGARHGN